MKPKIIESTIIGLSGDEDDDVVEIFYQPPLPFGQSLVLVGDRYKFRDGLEPIHEILMDRRLSYATWGPNGYSMEGWSK